MTVMTCVWEESISETLSVSVSQLRFTLCLFVAILVGWLQHQIRSVVSAHVFAVLSGIALVYVPFGNSVFCLLPPLFVTFLVLRLAPGRSACIVWSLCFPYLISVHFFNASGAAWRNGAMDGTGALMVLFLKLVSIAQCRQNAIRSKTQQVKLTDYEKSHLVTESPSMLEFLSYLFCFGSLLSGPFMEFSEYKEYVERRGVWSRRLPSRWWPFLGRVLRMVGALILLVLVGMRYQYDLLFTESYNESNLVEKCFIVSLVATCYRLRYYFAWSTMEVTSIASGFGFQGNDYSHENKWDRCKNTDILKTELPSSFVKIPHHWNICTGRFLRRYVYDQLTPSNGRPTFLTLLLTQTISGFWHGLYPGYFLFFLSAALAQSASKVIHKWEQTTSLSQNPIYKVLRCIYCLLCLNCAATAFIVLSFDLSIKIYRSTMFIPQLTSIGILLLRPLLLPKKSKTS